MTALDQIREILWPSGDADRPWSPDTLDAIAQIVKATELRPTKVVHGKLRCPDCKRNTEFKYYEDIMNYRTVRGIENGVLVIEGFYETDGSDDGENPRLCCQSCFGDFALPKAVEVDFV